MFVFCPPCTKDYTMSLNFLYWLGLVLFQCHWPLSWDIKYYLLKSFCDLMICMHDSCYFINLALHLEYHPLKELSMAERYYKGSEIYFSKKNFWWVFVMWLWILMDNRYIGTGIEFIGLLLVLFILW